MSEEKEVSRKEWIKGTGVWLVTTERPAWKVVGSAVVGQEFGPYESEEEAQAATVGLYGGSLVASYMHRSTHYERNGKRID